MGIRNQAENTVLNHLGAAKEGTGKFAGDPALERGGQEDQASAGIKQAGGKANDAATTIGDNLKHAALEFKDGFSK